MGKIEIDFISFQFNPFTPRVGSNLVSSLSKLQILFIVQPRKAIEQYFHVLFIVLYKVVVTFKSVDETKVCDHSNESY